MNKIRNGSRTIVSMLVCLSFLGSLGCAGPSPTRDLFLTISQPSDGAVVNGDTVMVEGRTTSVGIASVNGEVAEVDKEGNFRVIVSLDEGVNFVEIVASDSEGNEESALLTVFRE